MTKPEEPQGNDRDGDAATIWRLAALAVVLWIVYFALAYPPGGAPFVYAEF